MGGFFHEDWMHCLIRARYQEKSSATPSGRPALPAPSPPPPLVSPGIFEARRLLISEALGPGGSFDLKEEGFVSVDVVDTETFFLVVLTLTWCLGLGGTGSGIGSGFVAGVGVGSAFCTGSGSGSGVGVGFVSSIGASLGTTGVSDFGFWISDAGWVGLGCVEDAVGEGRPGPGRRDPRSIISTGWMGAGLWHCAKGRPKKMRRPK